MSKVHDTESAQPVSGLKGAMRRAVSYDNIAVTWCINCEIRYTASGREKFVLHAFTNM